MTFKYRWTYTWIKPSWHYTVIYIRSHVGYAMVTNLYPRLVTRLKYIHTHETLGTLDFKPNLWGHGPGGKRDALRPDGTIGPCHLGPWVSLFWSKIPRMCKSIKSSWPRVRGNFVPKLGDHESGHLPPWAPLFWSKIPRMCESIKSSWPRVGPNFVPKFHDPMWN